MLMAIISDLHANLEATRAVFREIDKLKPDAIFSLGDLAGYNANPNEVIDIIRERGIPTVMGNHDAAVCGLEQPWFFRASARKAIEWQLEEVRDDNKTWLATAPERLSLNCESLGTHGSPGCRDGYINDWVDAMQQMKFLDGQQRRVCFFGHTHYATLYSDRATDKGETAPGVYRLLSNQRYLINPGAVGQPRDNDPRAAFGMFDTDKMLFTFCRVEYDIAKCQRSILHAGLPKDLAARLAKGK